MNVMKKTLFGLGVAVLAGQSLADNHGSAWTYSGESGPEHWGSLAAGFELCRSGLTQSPIELDQANATGDLKVSVDWAAGPLTVSNRGMTVQADFAEGSFMTSGGKVFELIQVHFHTPSEHTHRGRTYPLVAHFVHATDEGTLGVLGVLFEQGEANPELAKILDAVPSEASEPATISGVTLNPNGMLPDEIEVWRYMGSLTTPPCSERVHWHVVEDTVTASRSQISAMEGLMGHNARPVQPLNNRLLVAPES